MIFEVPLLGEIILGAPQLIYMCLVLIGVGFSAQEKDFKAAVLGNMFVIGLLLWGGFFTP